MLSTCFHRSVRRHDFAINQYDFISNFYIYPLRFEETVRGAVLLVEDSTERSQLEQAIAATKGRR